MIRPVVLHLQDDPKKVCRAKGFRRRLLFWTTVYNTLVVQDYDAFYEAVDEDRLHEFLGLERPGAKTSGDHEETSADEVAASVETVSEEIHTTIAVSTVATQSQFATT